MAHPRKLSEEVIARAEELIAEGYKTQDVYAHPDIDVTPQSWYRWKNIGKDHYEAEADPDDLDEYERLCLRFYKALQTAEVLRKNELLRAWRAQSMVDGGDYRAIRDWLKTNYPDEFSEKRNLDVTSDGEKVDFRIVLTDEDDYEDEE